MGHYLERLDDATALERGFDGEPLVTRSGGGAMTFARPSDRPFETIISGPVAGAVGRGRAGARSSSSTSVITADVGGTSFDTCLITDGPAGALRGSVVGLPLQTAWVDVRSIGAGGGSIAYVDDGGLLRVGPRSAGRRPGPACYGRGGTEPTVTDAAVVLGMLPASSPAASALADAPRRRWRPLAGRLGFDSARTSRAGR